MMEVDGRTSHSNENKLPETSIPLNEQKKERDNAAENNTGTSEFVNHAAIAWEESRKKWIGDISKRPNATQKDPVISWSMTYEDLLSTHDPFPRPIPLPSSETFIEFSQEMVDFLVDIWHEDEGLFD